MPKGGFGTFPPLNFLSKTVTTKTRIHQLEKNKITTYWYTASTLIDFLWRKSKRAFPIKTGSRNHNTGPRDWQMTSHSYAPLYPLLFIGYQSVSDAVMDWRNINLPWMVALFNQILKRIIYGLMATLVGPRLNYWLRFRRARLQMRVPKVKSKLIYSV